MQGLVFQYFGRDFVLFGEEQEMPDDPITDADLDPIQVSGEGFKRLASMTWSCGLDWYVLVRAEDMLLVNAGRGTGIRCRRKTWGFLAAFVDKTGPARSAIKKKGILF